MRIAEEQGNLIAWFNSFDDQMAKYSCLIEMGSHLEPLEPCVKQPQNLVKGCQSDVWMVIKKNRNGKLSVQAESDSFIVNGILYILISLVNDHEPGELKDFDFEFLQRTDLASLFSATRNDGVRSLVGAIKQKAKSFSHFDSDYANNKEE